MSRRKRTYRFFGFRHFGWCSGVLLVLPYPILCYIRMYAVHFKGMI